VKSGGVGLALAAVRDLREQRCPTTDEELADYETDLLAGFVLTRASAGLADGTIRNGTNHLELIQDWFDRPLWERVCHEHGRLLEVVEWSSVVLHGR
jgi:hypothetical protein